MIKDLVLKNRTYRRFYEDAAITREQLTGLIELARTSSSAANAQPLKFYLSAGEKNEEIFQCLGWAGYLKSWPGPEEGERPAAYIVILKEKALKADPGIDIGIACQSILLGATEMGFGGCMFGNVNRKKLAEYIALPEELEIPLVIALGKPKETVVIEEIV